MESRSTGKSEKNLDPISQRIWRIRRESGLTDARLIEISGRSNGWWHRLKHSTNSPSDSSISLICERLGLPKKWIKEGDGEPDWEEFRGRMKELKSREYQVREPSVTYDASGQRKSFRIALEILAEQLHVSIERVAEKVVKVLIEEIQNKENEE